MRITLWNAYFVVTVLVGWSGASVSGGVSHASSPELTAAERRLMAAATSAGVAWPLSSPRIRIVKGHRLLELYSGDTLVRSYRVGLGSQPELDKEREGDHRTPEGEFYVCTRNDRSSFHLFLGVSYPAPEDAERGLRERRITRAQYNAILRATRDRVRPPWDTRLGGLVGIHGGGSSQDWTWGCIALEDSEIEELWVACPLGTPITIER